MTEDFISSQPEDARIVIQKAFETIMATDIAAHALNLGDRALDFQLPNVRGGTTGLYEMLEQGPVVLSFYRGGWCPYCNLEFKALSDVLPQIHALGARLIGVSPELPDGSLDTVDKYQLPFEVLSDVGNVVARQYGIVMDVPAIIRPLYLQWGLNVPAVNGDDSWELPVPATYVINSDGRIACAYINKDYTRRLEPDNIIDVLEKLATNNTESCHDRPLLTAFHGSA